MDKHGAGVCDIKCAGGEYVCGGSYAITVYQLADVDDLLPADVSGAMYLGCYIDEPHDRVMTLKEKRDDMTAEVCHNMMLHAGVCFLVTRAVRYGREVTQYVWYYQS